MSEDFTRSIEGAAKYYGLSYYPTKTGVVLHSGSKGQGEYWVIKLTKNGKAPRKLLHQNHGRSGKSIPLPCKIDEITTDITREYFHVQDNLTPEEMKDIRKVCKYIANHGNVRRNLDSQRQEFLRRAFA